MTTSCVPEKEKPSTETYEDITGYIANAGSLIAYIYHRGNPVVGGTIDFLTGQNEWVAVVADLAHKAKNGTAKPEDYADVFSKTAVTLAGFGMMIGKVSSPVGWTVLAVDVGLSAWKNRDKLSTEYVEKYLAKYQANAAAGGYNVPPDNLNFPEAYPFPEYNPPQDNDNTDTGWGAGKDGGCGAPGGPGQGGKDPANEATVPRRGDPLTFDLDGDGIETTGRGNRVVFDHNADGVKNGTGWVNADDGLLVLDRDGNGTIDNGRELFGDNTIKRNGERAKNGFDALADFDLNADGKIDALDDVFANLRIWRDLNQDGISQSNELLTLSDLNIASINLQNTKNNINLNGTGNAQTLAANLFVLF